MSIIFESRVSQLVVLVVACMLLASTPVEAKRLDGKVVTKVNLAKVNPQTAAALKTAIDDYNHGKYRDAVLRLEDVDKKGLCNDRTHYYIGLCYQCMNQTVLAKMHYAWVLQYGHDATLKAYAQSAYQQIAYYQGHRTYDGQGNNFARSRNGYERPNIVASSEGSPPVPA